MASGEHRTRRQRTVRGANWCQERRLEFIEFRLLWEGKINRGELVDFFRTSIQQASLDLARYSALAPGNLAYDKREKVYKAPSNLIPVLTQRDCQVFLNQLTGMPSAGTSSAFSFIGSRTPFDVVESPSRSIQPDTLMRVIWAIRDRQEIEVQYQSMRNPSATRRWIAPHAIAFDGSRWHVRAWCHENNYFKDFVFSRIQQILSSRKSEVVTHKDLRWHSFATLVLRARGDLSETQRAAVETEYGMRDGTLRLRMREALVPYFIRQMRLDLDVRAPGVLLEWVNRKRFKPVVAEAKSR